MSNTLKPIISIILAAALLMPSGWLAPVAKAAEPEIPVILYHRIVANATDDWTHTSLENFTKQMKYLDDNGYNTLSAEQYIHILEGTEEAPDKPILLTFDDATPDFITSALPVLKQYGMKSVQFVISDWIDGGYSMTTEQLEALVNEPSVSLQNHTKTHNEAVWTKDITKEQADEEIAAANDYLESITGEKPVLMAYPYGSFNANAEEAAQENGIKYAFKVGTPNQGSFAMARHYMMRSTTMSQFAAMVGGPVPEEPDAGTITVYRETFASGAGFATKSGGANLTPVTGKAFEGNDDGAALYVSNRKDNWDAADFKYADIGLENGKTYTVTASVYVDAGVDIPEGAQAYIQTISSYGVEASANYEAGKGITLTGSFTVDESKDTTLRVQSNEAGKAVPFYIGEILITAEKPAEIEREVYHETFADSKGVAAQSGGALLTPVTNKLFEGNDDGAALYISNRKDNWDAADFTFADTGLVNGKTYTVTASVYVDSDVTVPGGAQAYLQTIGSYDLLASANYEAGKAIVLTKKFTVDTSKDSKLRIQSNEAGKTVPFYIGDIRITEKAAPDDDIVPPQDQTDLLTDFENNTVQGWKMRNGVSGGDAIAASSADKHTGTYSLLTGTRKDSNDGPMLDITTRMAKSYKYRFTAWVKMAPGEGSAPVNMALQISYNGGQSYPWIVNATQVTDSEWVKLEGEYTLTSSFDKIEVYLETGSNKDTKRFYIDDFKLEQLGVNAPKPIEDLPSIYEEYESDFLIGNAVSMTDLDGDRLELLKLHHNVVTAENAMKPDYAYNTNKQFDFTAEDALVAKIKEQDLLLHGHVLVWHQQMPVWLSTNDDGTPLDRDTALANLERHIETVIEHFGGDVISWDVVNEAMNDNPQNPTNWKGALRQSNWYKAIGPDYVEQAFSIARRVVDENNLNIKLYYNDYNDDNQNKATAIASMVKELNDKYAAAHNGKLLIDGIGMQAHYNLNTKPDNVEKSLERFIALGVEVSITEIDITAGTNSTLTDKQAKAQGYLYAQLMKIYKENAGHIARVTFWGLNDASSWRASQSPLLFDKDLQAKPAYYGVIDPDKFIAENPPDELNANRTTANYGTPVIDGTIDSVWNTTVAIPINRYQMAWQGAHGTAKALWDDSFLYVLFQVTNAELDKSSPNAYEEDSIEVFLDQNNGKTASYEEDDGQYRVNYDNETSFNPVGIAEGFASATKVAGTNYTVEVKIPLKHVTPANDAELGFDVQINDGKDGSRQSVAAWNDTTGQGYQDTSIYGVLKLLGKAATGPIGGPYTPPAGSVEGNDGTVTIKPSVKNEGGRVIGQISNDNLKRALELAAPSENGQKQIVIEVPKQANANAYEVQLPGQSLNGEQDFVLLLQTENATIEIPSNMLSNAAENAEQVSLRVTKASAADLDEATREQIGDRPALDLSVAIGDQAIAWNNPNAPVTVSVPYTPTEEELGNPDSIVVWYIADNGDVTAIPNGRYDEASGMVMFRTTHFSTYAVTSVVKTFGDLNAVPWAKQAVEAMAARDVIKGTSADSFSPSDSIKRADFIALLVKALELQGTGENATMFSDVQAADYYYGELLIAKELGIATGYSDGTFKPDRTISRQDMMALTTRALAAAGNQLEGGDSIDAYPDAADISDYAADSAASLVEAGVVNGKNGKLAPNASLTRAEAAVILYRIWNL